ncbi:uncharacterized protein LOC122639490 [Telopea speciosissima]|uniref:uncharacterized protein LOC122639490 n=1 Tax=Telopea speciosissima TaxID=54955 RepID=UPI001CC660AA|nr:uncharacterized protein LOC122639490 [Telopea speciosissima]
MAAALDCAFSTFTFTTGCSSYDVFLNFRGEDTRNNLTGFLNSVKSCGLEKLSAQLCVEQSMGPKSPSLYSPKDMQTANGACWNLLRFMSATNPTVNWSFLYSSTLSRRMFGIRPEVLKKHFGSTGRILNHKPLRVGGKL